MAKRRKDPCAAQRQRLDDIDAQIAKVLDELSDPDIPPGTRKKLLAKLKQLQARRQAALAALDRCELTNARRGGTR